MYYATLSYLYVFFFVAIRYFCHCIVNSLITINRNPIEDECTNELKPVCIVDL